MTLRANNVVERLSAGGRYDAETVRDVVRHEFNVSALHGRSGVQARCDVGTGVVTVRIAARNGKALARVRIPCPDAE